MRPASMGGGDDLDDCRRCDLWRNATQGVPGEGPRRARVLLVGEQPGDEEDRGGRPFIGPAGRILDVALERAGLDREGVYVTNAVKHFKWEPRGKRRLHKKPDAGEISACLYWLERELARVRPDIIVAMGATALRALMGKSLPVGANRGRELEHASGARVIVTWHPSAVLRARGADREALLAGLVEDLTRARTASRDPR